MRITITAILLGAQLVACRHLADTRPAHPLGTPQIVALCVSSDPPGAAVRVNRIERIWTTPCEIADFSIQRGLLDVEVSLEGRPVQKMKVMYDGSVPARLDVAWPQDEKRAPGATLAPPGPEKRADPAPVPPPGAEPPPRSVSATLAPGASGTWLRVNSQNTKLRISAKRMVTDAGRPGELFLPDVPPEKAVVEFLDPKTDAVLQSVEIVPGLAPAGLGREAAPREPLPGGADRVGEVKVVSKTYGVFVKLDPGLSLQPGEEILIYREGREVARAKILKVTRADPGYPDGAALLPKDGTIQKGDEARRQKP